MKAILLLVAAAIAWPATAAAQEVEARQSDLTFKAHAEYRFLAIGQTDLPLDEKGVLLGQNAWLEQRIRVLGGFAYKGPMLRVELGVDLFSGYLAGDTSTVGKDYLRQPRDELTAGTRFVPRRAMVAFRTSFGEFRLGHQTSDWGYGLLANSGERELDFDDQRYGDLVERIAFATRPARNVFVAVGADLVYRDPNADLLEGDIGINAILSLFYRTESTFIGVYGAYRNQWDREINGNRERLEVGAIDFHARTEGRLDDGKYGYTAGIEGVALFGHTTRLRPEPDLEGARITAGAVVGKASLTHRPAGVSVTLEAGFVSGDNHRTDGTVRYATLNPDFRVGMILFNELMGGLSAHSADRLGDPAHVAQAPPGTAFLPTNGGIQNAMYLWPRLSWEPMDDLFVRFGALFARAPADVIDPYTTNTNGGGANRNFFDGAADARDLGIEVQAGARYSLSLFYGLAVHLGLEWAHLFPGAAFDTAKGEGLVNVDRVIGRVVLDWRYE